MRDGAVYFGEERGPSGSRSWTVAYPTGNNLRALSQITQKHTFQETWQSQWREKFQTRNFKCLETYKNVLTLCNRGIHIKPAITHLLFSVWPEFAVLGSNPKPWALLERALLLSFVGRLWGSEAQSSYVAQACLRLPMHPRLASSVSSPHLSYWIQQSSCRHAPPHPTQICILNLISYFAELRLDGIAGSVA